MPRNVAAKINRALFSAALLGGCAPVDASNAVALEDQACEHVMAVLTHNKTYRADQMAGCDGGMDDSNPGFHILRVKGFCRDPQGCGSVLMGWYAVEASTGAVHDWDAAEWQLGPRIDGKD